MIVHGPTNRHSGDILSGISMANNLKKTGSKADLELCIFSTNRRPFFPISQIGNINQQLNKKVISMKSSPSYSEMNPLSPSGASRGVILGSCCRGGGEGDSGWSMSNFL